MGNKNDAYGAFMVSKNVVKGISIRYTFREKSSVSALNGWTVYSEIDDDEFICNPENFAVLSAESMYQIAPQMIELFEAPYGTDLFWKYEEGVHVGFYDLKKECDTTFEEILKS